MSNEQDYGEVLTPEEEKIYNTYRSRGYLSLGAEINSLRNELAESEKARSTFRNLWDTERAARLQAEAVLVDIRAEEARLKVLFEGKE